MKELIAEWRKFVLKEIDDQGYSLQFGDRGNRVVELQQILKDLGLLRFKSGVPTGYFGRFTRRAVRKYQSMYKLDVTGIADPKTIESLKSKGSKTPAVGATKQPVEKTTTYVESGKCPEINGTEERKTEYAKLSNEFKSKGVPLRSACEIAFVKVRPQYAGKNFFVVDTKQNLIYLFSKDGNFVGKSYIIDGKNAQSKNEELIAKVLENSVDWERKNNITSKNGTYYDKNGKDLGKDAWYDYTDKIAGRFLPKGIYPVTDGYSNPEYSGGGGKAPNVYHLQAYGKEIGQAIHGYYREEKRRKWLDSMKTKIASAPNSPAVSKEFLDYVRANSGKESGGNMSYGCINLPDNFLRMARPYLIGSLVFVIDEAAENYLVQNSTDFFKKSETNPSLDQYVASYSGKTETDIPAFSAAV